MKPLILLSLSLFIASAALASPTVPPPALDLDLVVDIEPVGGDVILPPSGGEFTYTVTVTNNTQDELSGCIWVLAARPGEVVTDPIRPVQFMTIGPGEVAGPFTFTDRIQARAAPGNYHLMVHVGAYNTERSMVLYADSFKIVKEAGSGATDEVPSTEASVIPVSGAFPGPTLVTAGAAEGVEEVVASPNPGRSTTLRFTLARDADIHLAIYDLLGRQIALLVDGPVAAGTHAARFDGALVPAGTYAWRLVVGDQAQTGRVTILP